MDAKVTEFLNVWWSVSDVHTSEKLTFARHVDIAVGRVLRMLGVLIRGMQQPRNLRSGALDFRTLRTAYHIIHFTNY